MNFGVLENRQFEQYLEGILVRNRFTFYEAVKHLFDPNCMNFPTLQV